MNIGATRNRNLSPEFFDFKQRIVGGIVLFLIMMLLYYLLKAILGIQSTGADVIHLAPLPDEILIGQTQPTMTTNTEQTAARRLPAYLLTNQFVFLDLDGNPLRADNSADNALLEDIGEEAESSDEDKWYVQVASFREVERARIMVDKIKQRANLDALIVEVLVRGRTWYAVRLPAQANKRTAEQQQRILEQASIRQTDLRKVR